MKKEIHPSNYREVVFKDMSNDEIFITRSTVASREKIEVVPQPLRQPLEEVILSSTSHRGQPDPDAAKQIQRSGNYPIAGLLCVFFSVC